ncbi:MAG: hypothetical protein Q9218_006215 [Villophora microphyllina]
MAFKAIDLDFAEITLIKRLVRQESEVIVYYAMIEATSLRVGDANCLTANETMPHPAPSLDKVGRPPDISTASQTVVVGDDSLRVPHRNTTSASGTQNPSPSDGTDAMPVNRPTTARPHAYTHDPSYTNSRTWVSPRIREKDEWKRLNDGIHSMNLNHPDHSPFVPKSFDSFLQHKADFLSDQKKEVQARYLNTPVSSPNRPTPALQGTAFLDRSFMDGRGAVLSAETIWCPWDEPTVKHPRAPWPNREEMREEGDERHTSQFGRFLALPRNPGNETVTYKQKSPVKQHFLDRVWDVPDPEDVGELIEEGELEELLGDDLLRELDR